VLETTALGVAWLAGQSAGLYPSQDEFAKAWALDRRFEPNMDEKARDHLYAGWRQAVARTLSRREPA
ncbi:MAG: glycerol kinase, partial [Pseudomonadota bacterium]